MEGGQSRQFITWLDAEIIKVRSVILVVQTVILSDLCMWMHLCYLQLRSFYLRLIFFTYGGGTVSKKDQTHFQLGARLRVVRQHSVLRRVLRRCWEGFWGRVFSEGFWEGGLLWVLLKKRFWEGFSEGVLRRGVSTRCLERPLGEYAPLGVRPIQGVSLCMCAFFRQSRVSRTSVGIFFVQSRGEFAVKNVWWNFACPLSQEM